MYGSVRGAISDGRPYRDNWDLPPGCSVSTNWRLLGTVHEFESTRSQMDSITMATAIRSKKWKATASPGGENREAGAGARSGSRRLISTVCCGKGRPQADPVLSEAAFNALVIDS